MVHIQSIQLVQNWFVTTSVLNFPTHPGSCSSTKMKGNFNTVNSINHYIDHFNREIGCTIRVIILFSDFGIDKKTQVWVIDLNDGHAFLS